MAVEVEITGNGRYAGARSAIESYTVVEESTPVEASDSSGATGQISFNAVEDPTRLGSVLLLNDDVKLTDGDRGETTGKINSLNSNDGVLSITADSRLGRLVIDATAAPQSGTFGSVLTYYLSLGGITTGIAIDASLTNKPVVIQGWTGDLWTKIKELCVYAGAEISLVKGNVVARPVRGRRALEINNSTENWSVSNIDLAQTVEIFYYDSQLKTDQLVYPKDGWNEDVTVYTVDANQTLEVNIPVDVSITSLVQPSVQLNVSRYYDATSVYSVAGNDGLPIVPAQWIADGGKLNVAIGEDGKSIDLTVTGAGGGTSRYAPYRIAMSAGPSDYYSSLRIVGTGVHFAQKSVTMLTGADAAQTSRKVGVSVDNMHVRTLSDALNLGMDVAGKWAAPQRTISISKADITRPGESSEDLDFATFGEFDAYAATNGYTTFAQFDAAWAGETFEDFDDYWYSLVEDSFDYQVFGNANGARVQWRRNMYRIRSATITDSSVQYTAEVDTTFSDFDASATGMTFADFDAMYAGLTFSDFALIPLANVKPEYDRG